MKKHIFSQMGRLSLFMFMFMGFFACQQDLQEPIIHSQAAGSIKIQAAKTWFEGYQKSGAVDRSETFRGMEVEWDKATASGNSVEMPFKVNGEYNFPSLYNDNLDRLGQQRLVIYDDERKGLMAYVFDYMPSVSFIAKVQNVHPNNFRSKKFDGMLAVHTFDSDVVRGYVWKEGKIIKELQTQTQGVTLRECSTTSYQWACGRVMGGPLQCSTMNITFCWTNTTTGGGGVGGGGGGDDGTCFPYYPGCGEKNAGDDIPEPPSTTPPNAIEYITLAGLSPCNTAVFNKLSTPSAGTQNSTTLNDMNNFIKLFSSNANSNIWITEARLINQNTGLPNLVTEGEAEYLPNSNTYKITLNTNVVENASQEFIAATIMHEIIHAYLSAYLGVSRNNDTQHPLMVEMMAVEFMADILVILFPTLSHDSAMGLSWSGFDATPTYQAKDIAERFRLQEINNYHKARTNGTGTPCQ